MSEAFSKFIEFKNTIEKEFGKKTKCMRSDNAGEYISTGFFQNCDDNGIQRQMTCPQIPQQSGVTEWSLDVCVQQACLGYMIRTFLQIFGNKLSGAHDMWQIGYFPVKVKKRLLLSFCVR